MIKKRNKIIIFTALIVILISSLLYSLAYRYLIERDEKAVTNSISSSSTEKNDVTYDDWNYSCNNFSINIEKKETGDGDNKITYYVAHVNVKDISSIKSAFAQNRFGRNITETTSNIASSNNAIFAINGDYYGFREDGIIIRNGTLYRDTPTRNGLAFFNDGTINIYDETATNGNDLLVQGVTNTFSFGPSLLDNGKAITNFDNVKIDSNLGNRNIDNSNPRTGIGMISPNNFVFVVVDGRDNGYSRGMTLNEFSQLFEDLGCTYAYNLDGGGSSTMYFNGRVVNNPGGKDSERKVSDIIYIN
ncbi:phosphodiester glycosidase family protein [Clostridium butyricum]|uniref:phosphodiester glycosidase family protein n=1 Tax=Clostridium butyricum TaxID=1492 RepID=UPI00168B6446|nr:phosphodiester glycosidase family protein [Clostridium butyricum]MDB2151139.1 phosphodiester glycosidase family protein [Clostridium butyricum]